MARHDTLTGDSLHVPGYVDSSDPGAVGTGKLWIDTSRGVDNNLAAIRNAGDTGWNYPLPEFARRVSAITTDATPTELTLNGDGSTKLAIPEDATWLVRGYIAARRTDVDDESAGYVFTCVLDNNAGTTALVGAVTYDYTNEDTVAWSIAVTASDADDALIITVTGEISKTIKWEAVVLIVSSEG